MIESPLGACSTLKERRDEAKKIVLRKMMIGERNGRSKQNEWTSRFWGGGTSAEFIMSEDGEIEVSP